MHSWHYRPGHRWRYDAAELPHGMTMRFPPKADASAQGACDCPCGRCAPSGEHFAGDGCVCRLLGCSCLEPDAA